jgi:3-phenylpropionate/trans-cinnamate dioxygenase ferredoxin reductase component
VPGRGDRRRGLTVRQVVVAGAGVAGLRAAQALRRRGYAGELTLVGAERWRPYQRPPLSKALLAGAVEPDSCLIESEGLEASWLLGRSATALDTVRRIVRLDGGDELPYEALVIATGSRARPWPAPLELDGVHVLRTLDDAIALRAALHEAARVAIVGAGLIGCEVAATLRGAGLPVAMVDVAPYPMPQLGPLIGERAARLHAAHGVVLHLGASVAGFEGRDRVEAVRLSDGVRVEADVVLLALGALPDSAWLEGSGVTLERGGVRCDEHCLAVGVRGVAAAGDVAAWAHPAGVMRVEHWANAAEMGLRAAENLLAPPDARRPHAPVPTFWSDQYDVKIRGAGLLGLAQSVSAIHDDPEQGRLVVEGRRAGRLVGTVTFNGPREHLASLRELARASMPSHA